MRMRLLRSVNKGVPMQLKPRNDAKAKKSQLFQVGVIKRYEIMGIDRGESE
jgi:hypothetical protein